MSRACLAVVVLFASLGAQAETPGALSPAPTDPPLTPAPSAGPEVTGPVASAASSTATGESTGLLDRFAPTLTVMLIGVPLQTNPPRVGIGFPSVRGGVRFALLPRSLSNYSMNYFASLELGLEGMQTATGDSVHGFGVTLRAGAAPVTRGGMFIPFAEGYLLATLSRFDVAGFGATLPRVGFGVSFNLFSLLSVGDSPAVAATVADLSSGRDGVFYVAFAAVLVTPRAELVWTPPSAFFPGVHTFELRLGAGF